MKKGNIKCECGQEFYYETIRDYVVCIKCGKRHELKFEPSQDIGEVGD